MINLDRLKQRSKFESMMHAMTKGARSTFTSFQYFIFSPRFFRPGLHWLHSAGCSSGLLSCYRVCRLSLACFRAYHHARKGSIRLGTVSPSCTEGLWFLCACVHIHGDEDYLHHQGGLRPPPVPKRAARKFHRRHPAPDRAEAPGRIRGNAEQVLGKGHPGGDRRGPT